MTLRTRQPTGRPSWPIGLIAGRQKAGKSWQCALASASPLIDRTFWVSIGEHDPDEYGRIPGTRFEIVEHDGSYKQIVESVRDVAIEPRRGAKPDLMVLDSGTRLWNMIHEHAQAQAAKRARALNNGRMPNHEVPITNDLWTHAKAQWQQVLMYARAHNGPVLITARLDSVAVMENGQATAERTDRIQSEKGLPYDVDFVLELPQRGEAWLSGVRSTIIQLEAKERVDGITIDELWRRMGLADEPVEQRRVTELNPAAGVEEPADA